jgi:adenylosuccinate synthase
VQDLYYPERFAAKLKGLLDYHNFVLTQYFKRDPVPFEKTRDDTLALVPQIAPMVADVAALLQDARRNGASLLFEGAQGALLDIDHGTYPYVTSSNCLAGAAAPGSGIGPQLLDYVLGIVKAYTTRVGTGPFPTELADETGAGLAQRGKEFGSVTGRPRRCGWLDIPALKRSMQLNGVDGLCITKLDVLDGMPSIRICIGYRAAGKPLQLLPTGAEAVAACEPVYEEMAGWNESTFGATSFDALPANARAYLRRIEQLTGVPIAMVSTGPERDETILLHHPFH